MDKLQIQNIIISCLKDYLSSQDIELEIDENTGIFGNESILDSLGLVTVIIDIESYFLDEGISITLTSEKAMSRKYSPFLTVKTLSDFIFEQIGENNE